MKRMILMFGGLAIAGMVMAYGVSPSQGGGQSGQGQPQPGAMPNGNGGFQMQPAPNPQPSNYLAPGAMPPQGGAQPQIQMNNNENVAENIKNYKPDDWAKEWEHIDIDTAKKYSNDPSVVFIDARSKVEYDQGHIPGSIPIPLNEFDQYYPKYQAKIKKARKLVTYCHGVGCKLSDKVAQKLWNDKKHRNVASFFGGWPQWQQNNMPVESGPEPKKHM